MQIGDFKSIVSTFSDPGTEILFEGSQVVISVNGDLIDATISTQSGDVYIDEGGGAEPASKWILTRLARLPLLATRLQESIPAMASFVPPSAHVLRTLTVGPQGTIIKTDDALTTAQETIATRSPLETTVLYITSDAGEGKTSLINQLARAQASLFIERKSDWLLVPIPLGGRHFLRFDDITVGALQNRYRFPFLYYTSFLEMVKMGVIVPAFDGFEEMFVESSSGEALSAMGILVGGLESRGAMIVAARKAYFEFENLKAQEKLFDTIRTHSVGFGKLELERWRKSQFLHYCSNRAVHDAEELYARVSERLSPTHPLLTRAVLVRRLIDVAQQSSSLEALLSQIQKSGADFFSVFVKSIIEREAREKWLDRAGQDTIAGSLLTVDEHVDLLSQIALAMWEARVDYLKRDLLEFTADYFCELTKKNAFQAQQIRERVRGHALLIPSRNASQAVEFDHDEFRLFFLGEGIANQIRPMNDRSRAEVIATFRRGLLPKQAHDSLIRALTRDSQVDRIEIVRFLLDIGSMEAQASYTQENCSETIIELLNGAPRPGVSVRGFAFGTDALRDKKLTDISFVDCFFGPTSLENAELHDCVFSDCKFAQLRIFDSTKMANAALHSCTVDALVLSDRNRETWDPAEIKRQLGRFGFVLRDPGASSVVPANADPAEDPEILDIEKILRYFMRSTHISESVMLMKLGARAKSFIDSTLPDILKRSIMIEIENRGGGGQRRFRLGVPLGRLNAAIAAARGSFQRFLDQFDEP